VAVIGEADGRSKGTRSLSVFLSALMLGFLALALLLLPLHFVSYAKAKAFFDWYVAVHGVPGKVGRYLTEETHVGLFGRLPIGAGVFGICGVTLALFKHKLARFLLDIPSEWTGVRNSLRDQFHGGTETALEIGAVFSVFVAGIFLRVWHVGRAIRYDEAWTYLEFASRPLVLGLSNYRAPNNHLLNTLLIHFSTNLFGNTIFGLRFPALAAGCLVILASWYVTRALYGRLAGILTAGCIAALPTFIEFSINARGYALQWLFILAVMWFGIVLQKNPSLRIGWLGFVVAGVAGMYSIPTTLIAIAGVFGWMLVSTLADGEARKLKSMSRNVALAGLAIGLLSILLYVPPLLVRGPGALMAKSIVAWQQQGDFVEGFNLMGQCAWVRWTEGVPTGALWILLGGLVIGLLFHRRVCEHRVPMTIALWLSAAIFAWACHVFAFPRVWSYLLLSTVMTASVGLSLVLTSLAGRSRIRRVVLAGAASVALAVFVGAGVIKQRALFTSNETGTIIDTDQIVDFLSTELCPGDSLVSNAIINYELLRRSPKLYSSLVKPEEAARVVAVVVKRTGSTELCRTDELVALLAAQDTADPASLAQQIDLNAYTPPEVRAKFLTSTVYSLERRGRIE
jgi:hypothetical protein